MVAEGKVDGADPEQEVEACTDGLQCPGSPTSASPKNHCRSPSGGPSVLHEAAGPPRSPQAGPGNGRPSLALGAERAGTHRSQGPSPNCGC